MSSSRWCRVIRMLHKCCYCRFGNKMPLSFPLYIIASPCLVIKVRKISVGLKAYSLIGPLAAFLNTGDFLGRLGINLNVDCTPSSLPFHIIFTSQLLPFRVMEDPFEHFIKIQHWGNFHSLWLAQSNDFIHSAIFSHLVITLKAFLNCLFGSIHAFLPWITSVDC